MHLNLASLILGLLLAAFVSANVQADPVTDADLYAESNDEVTPASPESVESVTTQALIEAAMALPEIKPFFEKQKGQTKKNKPKKGRRRIPRIRRKGIDFRIAVPEGVGGAITYTPNFPITTEVMVGTTGATLGVSAGVSYLFFHRKGLTPTVTLKFSHVRFTSYADTAAHQFIPDWDEDEITVKMAGRWLNMGILMGGLDWVSRKRGFHFTMRFGVARQIGEAGVGEEPNGKLRFTNWTLPAADIGFGGTF